MVLDGYKLKFATKSPRNLKMKTEMQAKDLFHRKSLIVLISLEIVQGTIYFV